MNLIVTCEGCGAIYRVMQQGEGADVSYLVGDCSGFWPDKYSCPRCGARASGSHEDTLPRGFHTKDIVDLTPEELLAALYELGLPDERTATLCSLRACLEGREVRSVKGHDVEGTERCCVDYLEMMDGTRIYLGASTHGAVAYRIVPPTSYVARLEEET